MPGIRRGGRAGLPERDDHGAGEPQQAVRVRGAATMRVKFKTQPLNQGQVGNELRRRLMTTFVGRGIKPFA